ncbi:hypothetical protein [Actinomadura sp. 6K520]|uniref:hypothetical protein n=1 Tax=Actinomadura sp. 6K520 TaxID=2530364 RepID=UPI001047E13A|nr:hypothetical protein [Actinomadura sp. 6K520]TDE20823.1 hypothetical protein E1289_31810 [Actinomadura sp. 6K520]
MSERLVVTRLHTLERVLCLTRPGDGGAAGVPAVLTIPRGGHPREPRLVLLGDRDVPAAARLGPPAVVDSHVVASCRTTAAGGRAGADRRDLADVLVDRPARVPVGLADRLAGRLHRHPGAAVVVAARPGGHLAVTRDGAAVAMRGSPGTGEVWAPNCGSFLYCWSAAGLAVAELARALLLVGRYTARGTGPGSLETAGRVRVTAVATTGRRLAS